MAHRLISDTCPYDASEAEVAAVCDVLGRPMSGTSEAVVAYEADLAACFGARFAVAVSSGSAAVMAAVAALGLRPGDEVALTPTCPLCTVYPLMAMGVVPVFVDTQPESFSLDLADLARVVSPRLRAIIDIPMWGYPIPVPALRAAADEYGLPLLLDLAHGHGVTVEGQPLWRYGNIATFSTHESKILSSGEGGFILTDDGTLAQRARSFAAFGNLDGAHLGLNLKLGGLLAALARFRLAGFSAQLKRRAAHARQILGAIRHPDVRELGAAAHGEPNYFCLLLQVPEAKSRAFIAHLRRCGIPSDIDKYGCRPLYEFPLLEAFARDCRNAKRLLGSITTIPVHPGLSAPDLEHIAASINAFEFH